MSKLSLYERLTGAAKKKQASKSKATEEQVKNKLKELVYDDELADELLPTFMALQGVDGFSKVLELLETKERQIEAISGGDWFNKQSEEEDKTIGQEGEDEEDHSEADLVDSILNEKYKGNK